MRLMSRPCRSIFCQGSVGWATIRFNFMSRKTLKGDFMSRNPNGLVPRFLLLGLTVLCISTSPVLAQCDPGGGMGGNGADVIVGELTGTQSYGNSGGYYAFSVGTTSCNIGDIELLWHANDSDWRSNTERSSAVDCKECGAPLC